ncbi:hypothetical protein AAG906_026027 [Vitis piasezkii]
MATVRRKRKEHLPATCSQVKLPKSRCSNKKFISIIVRLPNYKQDAIKEIGFGGLLDLTFLIFACATLLAPNSKLEGMHDLWDTIWDGDVGVQKNWSQFVLHFIEDGIREYRKNQLTYIRSCLIFLQVHGPSSTCDDATKVVDVFIDSKGHIRIIVVVDFALAKDVDPSMLNANQPHPPHCHYFDPSFSVLFLATFYQRPEKKKYLTDRACFFKLT